MTKGPVRGRKGREEQGNQNGMRHTRMQLLLQDRGADRILPYKPPADCPTIIELMQGTAARARKEEIPAVGVPRATVKVGLPRG